MQYDDEVDFYRENYVQQISNDNSLARISKLEKMICSLFDMIEGFSRYKGISVYGFFNPNKYGISLEEIRQVWKEQKQIEAAIKARQLAEKQKEELKQQTLAKLSKEEREALGFK